MPKSPLPARIREVRETRRLTQAELAEKSGLPAATISHFETGIRMPGTSTIQKLADALDVSLEYLLGRTEEPTLSGTDSTVLFRNARDLSSESLRTLADLSEQLRKRDEEKRGS